jgi:hypothetical protein
MATLLALALIGCGAESQTPALRPEFASRCGVPRTVAPGLERCENFVLHKVGPIVCPAKTGESTRGHYLYQEYQRQAERGLDPQCATDEACNAAPYGFCAGTSSSPLQCRYGCSTDAECGPGQACNCQEVYGVCVTASCTSDASCAPGFACTSWDDGCRGRGYACESPEDECASRLDCAEDLICIWDGARRVCGAPPECSETAG